MSLSIAIVGLKGSGKTNLMKYIKHGSIPEDAADAREYHI